MESSDRAFHELKLFHSIDRNVYARLVVRLGFDPNLSKYIVAFWYWLERKTRNNFMDRMSSQPDSFFCDLARQSIVCITYLHSDNVFQPIVDQYSQFPELSSLLPKDFPLSFVFENKEYAKRNIEIYLNAVCDRAFSDIVVPVVPWQYQFLPSIPQPSGIRQPNLLNYLTVQQGFQNSLNEPVGHNIVEAPQSLLPPKEAYHDAPDQYVPNVDQNERTLFLTFSKGHPISREELDSFFNRKFGDCVEAIHLKAEPNKQPLFARLIVKSRSDTTQILGGTDDRLKVKFSIHGKDCIARRFAVKI